MATALAFDLFLDEYDVLEDGKLFTHIENELKSKSMTTPRLKVVKNEIHKIENTKNDIPEKEIKNNDFPKNKSLFIKNEIMENENLKKEISFSEYSFKISNDISEIKILDSEKIRKDMMKGYMELLSN